MRPTVLIATTLVALLPIAAGAQQIGVVASVVPDLQGVPPGQSARALAPGMPLVASETIRSSGNGRGQLLFNDQTTLSISPNSEIVLDSFIYDPGTGQGSTALSLTRGALRFIGGKASRRQEATIRTPTAIIGVRGSSALVSFRNGQTRAILIAGDRLCVGGASAQTCTNRQGGIMTERGYAGQVQQAELSGVLNQIDGPPSPRARITPRSGPTGQTGSQARPDPQITTGLPETTDPRSPPVSSRGEPRDFIVFDEPQRSEAVLGITTGSARSATPPPEEKQPPEPREPTKPQPPKPQPPKPEPPKPEPPKPEPPAPEPPAPEPPAPEPPAPEPPAPEPPDDGGGPVIIIEEL